MVHFNRTLSVLAAACALAACGGDNAFDSGTDTPDSPGEPQSATLTIRPHLGSVAIHSNGAIFPFSGGAAIPFVIDGAGRAVVQLPAEVCGPGVIVLEGSPQTRYFDEGTGQVETLPVGDNVRKLVPDLCGTQEEVPLTQLDEIALHMPSDDYEGFIRVAEAWRRAQAAGTEDVTKLRQQATDAARESLDKIHDMIGTALALPPSYPSLNPTPIPGPGTALPQTNEGQLAAMAQALAQSREEARQKALEQRRLSLEAAAALHAQEITRLMEEAQRIRNATYERMIGSIINTMLGADTAASMRYKDNEALLSLKASLGTAAVKATQDVPDLLQKTLDGFPASQAQQDRIRAALQAAVESRPVANADLSMVVQASVAPLLLQAEPQARLETAVRDGQVEYACAADGPAPGRVMISFSDQDNSGALSHGDLFSLVYENCRVTEPLSGQSLLKSGWLNMTYAEPEPGGLPTERYADVSMDVSFRATGANAAPSLFRVEGTWQDRMAFGAPGEIADAEVAGTVPTVLIRQPLVTLWQGDSQLATQGLETRLDLSPDFSLAGGTGKAALTLGGMVSGVFFSMPATFVFDARNGGAMLTQGTLTYDRQYGGTGSGSLSAQDDGTLAVALTSGTGVSSARRMTWSALVGAYLAP